MKNNRIQKILFLSLSVLLVSQNNAMSDKTLALAGIGAGCVAAGVAHAYATRRARYYDSSVSQQNLSSELTGKWDQAIRDFIAIVDGESGGQMPTDRKDGWKKYFLGELDLGLGLDGAYFKDTLKIYAQEESLKKLKDLSQKCLSIKNKNHDKGIFDHIIIAAVGTGIVAAGVYGLYSAITRGSFWSLAYAGTLAGTYEWQRRNTLFSPLKIVRNSLLATVPITFCVGALSCMGKAESLLENGTEKVVKSLLAPNLSLEKKLYSVGSVGIGAVLLYCFLHK